MIVVGHFSFVLISQISLRKYINNREIYLDSVFIWYCRYWCCYLSVFTATAAAGCGPSQHFAVKLWYIIVLVAGLQPAIASYNTSRTVSLRLDQS